MSSLLSRIIYRIQFPIYFVNKFLVLFLKRNSNQELRKPLQRVEFRSLFAILITLNYSLHEYQKTVALLF